MFIAKYGFNKFFKDNLVRSGRFFIGNMLHTAVEHIVSEKMLIIDCKNEVQIKSKEYANIRFEGKVDMVIDDVPYEFKSSGAKYPLKAPYQANVFQLNTYMGICRWRHGIIVYVSKLDMHTQVFLVNFNPEMFKEAIMKANAVYEAIKTYQYPQEIPYPKCGCFMCSEEETYEMVEEFGMCNEEDIYEMVEKK